MPKAEDMEYLLTADTRRILDSLDEILPHCANQIRKEIRLAYLTGIQMGMRDVLDSVQRSL